ncbi:MAG: TolC family outer membrane protein [Proteobacteria bacterium]|nr:TolC family outer membrane protein [Pseudomonadota bacterium]MBS0495218.1 TolC family outer membrane protein [Pseudomonadota bacterium]
MKYIATGALLISAMAGFNANATDLLQAWQAAEQHDRELAVARAAHAAADPQRRQASSLWRPGVGVTAAAGWGYGESQMRGAQFTAPGFGTSNGVNFGTSITSGTATRVALQASQPLYNPERRAQQQQLNLQADMGDLQWQAAQQTAMLRTTQRYLDMAVAQEQLRVLDSQLDAVRKAAAEAQDRFDIGSAPITAVHEANAQSAQLQAQRLAAQTDLDIKRRELADATGLAPESLQARLPLIVQPASQAEALWQEQAAAGNPAIRQQQLAADIARAEADKHRASAAPKVDLVAQAGQDRLSGSGDYGSGARNKQTNAMLGVQLTVPLYTGGWRSAKEAESLAKWNEAQAQLDAAREQVARQVHAAWLGLQTGAQQVEALQQALVASSARQDATRTGYEVGHRTLLDVLHADNDHAATQLALAQARSRLLIHQLQLAQLAGRLDEAAMQQANQTLN